MRVMIAEDSGLFRQLLSEVLTGNGLTVTGQATTGSTSVSSPSSPT